MGLHVYCVVPPDRAPPAALRGVADAPVHVVAAGAVALWVSPLKQRPAASADAARRHNSVVAAAMDRAVTPVPARFGQWFGDDVAAAAHVSAEADHWLGLLRRFAGHAEYGIRSESTAAVGARTGGTAGAESAEPARELRPARPATGTAYMAQLARSEAEARTRERESADVAAVFARRLEGIAADARVETDSSGTVILAHLVAWSEAAAYHSVVRAVGDEVTARRFLFTGPWPPYSFVQ